MSDRLDDLESELRSLGLRPISPSVRDRIARQLSRRRRVRLVELAGSVAALLAVLVVTVLWMESKHQGPTVADKPNRSPNPVRVLQNDETGRSLVDSSPTLWEYRSAVMHSTHAIDDLFIRPRDQVANPAEDGALTVIGRRINFDAL